MVPNWSLPGKTMGTAPLYKNWKVWLYVTDETGNTIEKKQVEILLLSVLPGESIHTATLLETEELLKLAGEKNIA